MDAPEKTPVPGLVDLNAWYIDLEESGRHCFFDLTELAREKGCYRFMTYKGGNTFYAWGENRMLQEHVVK